MLSTSSTSGMLACLRLRVRRAFMAMNAPRRGGHLAVDDQQMCQVKKEPETHNGLST